MRALITCEIVRSAILGNDLKVTPVPAQNEVSVYRTLASSVSFISYPFQTKILKSPASYQVIDDVCLVVWSRWLDIGQVLFFACLWRDEVEVHKHAKKKNEANIQPS